VANVVVSEWRATLRDRRDHARGEIGQEAPSTPKIAIDVSRVGPVLSGMTAESGQPTSSGTPVAGQRPAETAGATNIAEIRKEAISILRRLWRLRAER
jgi:hypothetical protein